MERAPEDMTRSEWSAYRLSDRDAANSIIKKAKRAFLEATGHERDEAQLRFRRLLRSRAEVLRARLEDDEHRHAARTAKKLQMQRSSTRDNDSVTQLSQARHEARVHRVASAANERDSALEETQLSPGLSNGGAADEKTQLSTGLATDDDGETQLSPGLSNGGAADEKTQLRHSPGSDDDNDGGKEESIGEFSEHTPPPMLMPPVPFDSDPRRATCLSYFKGRMIHNHELCDGCRGRLHNRWTRCQRNLLYATLVTRQQWYDRVYAKHQKSRSRDARWQLRQYNEFQWRAGYVPKESSAPSNAMPSGPWQPAEAEEQLSSSTAGSAPHASQERDPPEEWLWSRCGREHHDPCVARRSGRRGMGRLSRAVGLVFLDGHFTSTGPLLVVHTSEKNRHTWPYLASSGPYLGKKPPYLAILGF